MMPKTFWPTPSGTASTERTPCSTTVPPAKRGSAWASEVRTALPLATTSSITERLMRISPISPARSRRRATATFRSGLFSSRIMIMQRSAGTASKTSDTICSRVSFRVTEASSATPTLLIKASKSLCLALRRAEVSSDRVRAPSMASNRPDVVRSAEESAIVASGTEAELSVIIVAPLLSGNGPSLKTISVSPIWIRPPRTSVIGASTIAPL